MQLDQLLHFGVLPHEILAPLFNYPFITFLVNVNYNLWFARPHRLLLLARLPPR